MRCHGYVDLEENDFFGKPNLYYIYKKAQFVFLFPSSSNRGRMMTKNQDETPQLLVWLQAELKSSCQLISQE